MLGLFHFILGEISNVKFSPSHFGNYPQFLGKLPNHSKIAYSGPWRQLFKICPENWFLFTKYQCHTAYKWPQMPHKWLRTIPFGSGHTLGTLNHGLGSLICCFITFFGAGGILDPLGTPWCPQAPPSTPWCPHDPWYVILGHSQSSWVIMSHVWPIWNE